MSNTLLVSTRKGLFLLRRSASEKWEIERVSFLGDNVTLTLADARSDTWFAALDHGHFGVKLHRSKDQGAHWEEVGVPIYPDSPEGQEEIDSMGQVVPWKLKLIWALAPGLASQPGLLWCGTIPGGLFYSEDNGSTWTLVSSLWDDPRRKKWNGGGADFPGIHSICVDPRDGKKLTLGISSGGVWQTLDRGGTWACKGDGMRAEYMPPELAYDPNIQDPHRVVQSPSNPDIFWVQHHNGIFRTTNSCQRWEEITEVPPSVFGFAVAVHPQDPETAWFVPSIKDERRIPVGGAVVVTRTRDGGRSFETLRNGLPQTHAYDLVYRHALAIDRSGSRLAFGSTTGSLWITENGGDDWQTVSEHLPPIYAAEFA